MRRRRLRAKRGQGSVYWDQTLSTWMAALTVGHRDGKRITRKRRARDEDDARRLLEGLRKARDAGIDPAKGTLGQYLRSWLTAKQDTVRPSTWAAYDTLASRAIGCHRVPSGDNLVSRYGLSPRGSVP